MTKQRNRHGYSGINSMYLSLYSSAPNTNTLKISEMHKAEAATATKISQKTKQSTEKKKIRNENYQRGNLK